MSPVSALRAVTVTPGSTPPCASLMMPEMTPLVVCAVAGAATEMSANSSAAMETPRNITPPFIRRRVRKDPACHREIRRVRRRVVSAPRRNPAYVFFNRGNNSSALSRSIARRFAAVKPASASPFATVPAWANG